MKWREMLKNKQFLLGLVLGIMLSLTAVGVVGVALTKSVAIADFFANMGVEKSAVASPKTGLRITKAVSSSNSSLRPDVILTFSEAMVSADAVGKPETRDLIQFRPEIKGTYKWMDEKTLVFTPGDNLKPSTTYKGTYNAEMIPADRGRLSNGSFEFKTLEQKNIKFVGMKVQGEMSLKPALLFTFSANPNIAVGQTGTDDLFEFTPAVKGRYNWTSPTSVLFTADESLEPNTNYTVKVKAGRFNQSGANLVGSAEARFKTSGAKEAKLLGVKPEGEIDPRDHLTFTFSEDVADFGIIGKTMKDDKIQLNPPVEGSYRWISSRELRFLPEVPLLPSTQYQVSIKPEIVATRAFTLAKVQTAAVKTRNFEVVNCSMNFVNTSSTAAELNVKLVFNYTVKPEDIEKYLKLSLITDRQETKLAYKVKPYADSDTFEITVSKLERVTTPRQVKLVIDRALAPANGSSGLQTAYSTTATLSALDPIVVNYVESKIDFNQGTIIVELSRSPEKESVGAFVSISPEVSYKVEVGMTSLRIKSKEFKPGQTYTVTLEKGLPASNGSPLRETFSTTVYFPELDPMLRFNADGTYLSSKGNLNLGLETVNIDKVNISIYKIFANNIVHFLSEYSSEPSEYGISNVGKPVEESTLTIKGNRNEVTTTPVPLMDYLADGKKGIYQVFVREYDHYWRNDSKIVIATDIGIVAKKTADELIVWVNSLKTLDPLYRAKVSLLSYNNQVIASDEANRQGVVRFSKMGETFKEYTPYVVLVELEDDFSFLKLSDSKLDMTDFDISGKPVMLEGYEAFLYSDRGVYRPGELAHVAAIIRGAKAALPPEFPVRLEVTDPTGRMFSEFVKSTGNMGAVEFEVNFPDYAKTGKYAITLYAADQEIGSTSISVEEFMPDRIKVEATTDKPQYSKGDDASIDVKGINLFGPPAAGRSVELSVKLDSYTFTPANFGSYTFGNPVADWKPVTEEVGSGVLDANGLAKFKYTFPDSIKPGSAMKAVFTATVREEGGRAVNTYKVVDFHPYDTYIGMKRLGEYYGEVGKPYSVQYVEVDKSGKAITSKPLELKVYRIIWNSIWTRDEDGDWWYDSEEEEEEILTEELAGGSGERTFTFTPHEYGEYKIIITNPDNGTSGTVSFYATGWGYSPWTMSAPTKIELDLSKDRYEPGELAQIQVKAPFAGKALVTVEREKIYDMQIIEFKENTGLIAVNTKADWAPNVYVTVQMIRSTDDVEKNAPVRAYGTIPLPIDCSSQKLDVKIDAPENVRPNQTVQVNIEVPEASKETYLTLAAVDEGILQLTNYTSPDAFSFFYAKRKLDVESFDLYSKILPEVDRILGTLAPGGDADYLAEMQKQNLNPISVKRVKPVALWSGIVKVEDGKANVQFTLPQFNGSLRLTAVAFDGARFGGTKSNMIVRDPIVLTPTYPRAVAGNDIFKVPVGVFNGTGRDGKFTVKLKIDGPVNSLKEIEQNILLPKEGEGMVYFDLQAQNAAGKVTFTLEAEGNGEKTRDVTELAVRPAFPSISKYFSDTVKAGQPAKITLPGGWVPGSEKYFLTVSPFPAVKFAGSLQYLLRYPHGCAEQTTSRLFPLLYFDKLAEKAEPELFSSGKANYFMKEGIWKLQRMQLHDGSFSYWPGGDYTNRWASLYVSHFMVEARKADYEISNYVYEKMLNWVRSVARESASSDWELQNKVYALYILSMAGKPDLSNMAYVKNHQIGDLYEDSRTMLAAAYYYAGEREEAKKLIPFTYSKSEISRDTGGNFNSAVRTYAITLSVLADVDPSHPSVNVLMERLAGEAKTGYWGTTQENAFAFMAIGKLLRQKKSANFTGSVQINGKEIGTFSNEADLALNSAELGKGPITITLNGTGDATYYAQVSGVPLNAKVEDEDAGVSVRREYFDRTGQPLDLNAVKQGELVVAKITVQTEKRDLSNLVIADLIPAAMEIENPRLANSANIDWIQDQSFPVEYMDIRDDRLLLFTSLSYNRTYTFYYALRAVSEGDYIIPAIKAECMYEPEVRSISSGGRMKVVK